jgi:predicted transcriptional regulator
MATQIANDMKELKAIMAEIKKITDNLKTLRNRKKELENNILNYLEANEQPGVKYQELIVLRNERTTYTRKKPKEKESEIVRILEENGISDPKKVYHMIGQASKGEEVQVNKLRIKQSVPDLF